MEIPVFDIDKFNREGAKAFSTPRLPPDRFVQCDICGEIMFGSLKEDTIIEHSSINKIHYLKNRTTLAIKFVVPTLEALYRQIYYDEVISYE